MLVINQDGTHMTDNIDFYVDGCSVVNYGSIQDGEIYGIYCDRYAALKVFNMIIDAYTRNEKGFIMPSFGDIRLQRVK